MKINIINSLGLYSVKKGRGDVVDDADDEQRFWSVLDVRLTLFNT
jgi:hypothetical protein